MGKRLKKLKGATLIDSLAGLTIILIAMGIGFSTILFTYKYDPGIKSGALNMVKELHHRDKYNKNEFKDFDLDTMSFLIEREVFPLELNLVSVHYKVTSKNGKQLLKYGFIESINDPE